MKTLAFMFVAIMISSCATILTGSGGKIHVKNGIPENAQVFLNGNLVGSAPCKVKLKSSVCKVSSIEIKADGFESAVIQTNRKIMPGYIIADVIFCLIGLPIDFVTGGIYRPIPKRINYSLQKK